MAVKATPGHAGTSTFTTYCIKPKATQVVPGPASRGGPLPAGGRCPRGGPNGRFEGASPLDPKASLGHEGGARGGGGGARRGTFFLKKHIF